jgi:hypothetical protein
LTGLAIPGLALLVPGGDLPVGIEPASSGYLSIGENPCTIAFGHPEGSPSGSLEEVPIVVRLESDIPLPAGRYWMTLVFEASAKEPLP